MSKHTPSPWTRGTSENAKECVWLDGHGEPEEGMGEPGTWIDCNTEANARLIAASPEMLEALRAIDVGSCENFTTGYGSCAKAGMTVDAEFSADRICNSCIAHAAIAKATGEQA